jgi:hypothetical protein
MPSNQSSDPELDAVLAAIFQGQDSLPSDEALKRALALSEADQAEAEFNPITVMVNEIARNYLRIEQLEKRFTAFEERLAALEKDLKETP